jgi:uncharacterized membrane protein
MRNALIIFAGLVASCGNPTDDNSSVSTPGAPNLAEAPADDVSLPSEPATTTPATEPASANTAAGASSPCLVQGSKTLAAAPIRATGTEPFWSAQVEGRCVTYSTPENQAGVRVWTRYSEGGANSRHWLGQLNGSKFEMRVRPEPGCSDGMSDNRYPLAVELSVGGETRKGCARPD